jgi:uncharacterized protein (DUF1800 family)
MVDRLFWRAGFGPSADDRATWTGRHADELVDWMLNTTPGIVDTTTPPPLNSSGTAIDPQVSDDELITDWLDTMQRVDNPLPERLAFFWHRHWAVSRDDGIPYLFLLKYLTLLRKYATFSTNPDASFRQLAYDVSTTSGAMSWYLDGNTNGKGKPNENYAREFQELFCLGPTGPDGTPNYTQKDVTELARAFTGWRYNNTSTQLEYGDVSFNPSLFDAGSKTLWSELNWLADATIPAAPNQARPTVADGPACVGAAVDIVLAHPNHAQFLIRKLWGEFIASPIPADTLASLSADYRASGYKLKPLIRSILLHPLIFESIDEPNLVKPRSSTWSASCARSRSRSRWRA